MRERWWRRDEVVSRKEGKKFHKTEEEWSFCPQPNQYGKQGLCHNLTRKKGAEDEIGECLARLRGIHEGKWYRDTLVSALFHP